jgi:hypothetical protein
MSRREKCRQLEEDMCPGESKPERQAECLRSLCSDRQTRCEMAKSILQGCGKSTTQSAKYQEMCGWKLLLDIRFNFCIFQNEDF